MRRGVGAFAVREVGNPDMYSPSTVRGQGDEGSLERKHTQGVSISATQDRPPPQSGCQTITQVASGHQYEFLVNCVTLFFVCLY